MDSLATTGLPGSGLCRSRSAETTFSRPNLGVGTRLRKNTTSIRLRPSPSYDPSRDLLTQKLRPQSGVGLNGWLWRIGWLGQERRICWTIRPLYTLDPGAGGPRGWPISTKLRSFSNIFAFKICYAHNEAPIFTIWIPSSLFVISTHLVIFLSIFLGMFVVGLLSFWCYVSYISPYRVPHYALHWSRCFFYLSL